MANVVSTTEIAKRFSTLGWTSISVADVADALKAQSIAGASLIAYLDAAIASPAGFNDQTIAGCPAADANKITTALKTRLVVTT